MATRQREMRTPGTQFGFESDFQRCFLDTFVQLKEMRMALSHTDPNYFHQSFWRKCPNAFDRKKERTEFDRA